MLLHWNFLFPKVTEPVGEWSTGASIARTLVNPAVSQVLCKAKPGNKRSGLRVIQGRYIIMSATVNMFPVLALTSASALLILSKRPEHADFADPAWLKG